MSGVEWTDAEHEAAREAMGVWQGTARDVHVLDALVPFVAARESQAAAKALRDAASWLMDLPSRRGPAVYADERIHADGQDIGIELAAGWLRDRADRIERGESS